MAFLEPRHCSRSGNEGPKSTSENVHSCKQAPPLKHNLHRTTYTSLHDGGSQGLLHDFPSDHLIVSSTIKGELETQDLALSPETSKLGSVFLRPDTCSLNY